MNRYLTLLCPVAAALLLAGCSHHKSSSDAEAHEASAESIDVAYPLVQSVTLSKSYPGYLTAYNEVALKARVSGTLKSVNYAGGPVKKGAVLFTIEDTQYRDAVAKAEADLASAEAQRTYNASHLEALEKALESDAVSRMEVEQARSALLQSEAAIKTARATLTDARTQLGYCVITAPFDGRVSTNAFDPGAFIDGEASPTTLATIYNEESFTVNFNIEDAQFLKMLAAGEATGNEVDLQHIPVKFSDAMPHDYTAAMSYISPNVDRGTGTYSMQAVLQNPYNELRSGMYITIDLPYARLDSALLVNAASIGTDQRGSYLYTVNDSNRVAYTPVQLGEIISDTLRVVTGDVTPSTRYVTKALLKVRPGMTIKANTTN